MLVITSDQTFTVTFTMSHNRIQTGDVQTRVHATLLDRVCHEGVFVSVCFFGRGLDGRERFFFVADYVSQYPRSHKKKTAFVQHDVTQRVFSWV